MAYGRNGARKNGALSGKLVALIGGSGFFGGHVAQELLACGVRLRVISRNPERAYRLRPLGNLGQMQFLRGDVTRPETIAPVVAGCDAVVNLVGAFAGDLDSLQGQGAGRIAAIAREVGVSAYVQISALGADAASAVAYNRTKAEGEQAVLDAFPTATILRPSVLFAEDDHFVNMFAGLIAAFPVMPVFAPNARLQPLFVDDAAEAVVAALANPAAHGGKRYDIAGPEQISMIALNRRIAAAQGRQRLFIELPDAASSTFALLTGWLPGAPLSRDQWALLKDGNVLPGTNGLADLGIAPRPLDLFLDRWMTRYRKHGRFGVKARA